MSTRLPDVSSPLARLLDSRSSPPSPSFGFSRHSFSRNRKLVFVGAAALSIALFLVLRDLSTFSAHRNTLHDAPPPAFESPDVLTVTVTATTTTTAPAVTETVVVVPQVEPVEYVLIAWSEDAASEATLLIKSVLIYTSSPSVFHIICDDVAEQYIRVRLALVKRPLHKITVNFHQPSWQSMMDRIDREGSINTDHSAGIPGLMKLFIHEILPESVNKVLFLDTDTVFIADPTLLWNVETKPTTAFVMASHPDHVAEEWHNASRICSCIMILNLKKLRQMRLMDSSIYREDVSGRYPPALAPSAFRAMYGTPEGPNGRYNNVRLGDQGYWWAIVDHNPHLFEPLSFDFEITSCLVDTYLTGLGDELVTEEEELSRQTHTKDTPQEGKVVLPKLLHFNCLHGTPRFFEWEGWQNPFEPLNMRYGAAVRYHFGYKWIWLNQGKEENPPEIVSSPVVFADEEFAKQQKDRFV